MLKLFIPLIAFILAISPNTTSLSGKWKLLQFKNLATGKIQIAEATLGPIELTFQDSIAGGTFSGYDGCNSIWGAYSCPQENKIIISGWAQTKRACLHTMDKIFSDALLSATNYNMSHDTLFIFYNHNYEEMIFIREGQTH